MDGKYTIFDTIVIGVVFALFFALTLAVWDQALLDSIMGSFEKVFARKGDLLAKWVAVGVGCHIIGAIIQVVSICIFRLWHYREPARACLRSKVAKSAEMDTRICTYALNRIRNAEPDSIFAWVHYSDPRKDLIEWGRRKARYWYLAENWIVAIASGSLLGLVFSKHAWILEYIYNLIHVYAYTAFQKGWTSCLLVAIVVTVSVVALFFLRRQNMRYNEDMIMMYVAGRIWQGLEDEFLPKQIQEESGTNKERRQSGSGGPFPEPTPPAAEGPP